MPDATITFELGGRIDIKQMEKGVTVFRQLISALTGKSKVDWVVEDLQPGSATTTVRGECEESAIAERIVREYEEIGKALQNKEEIQTNNRVIRATDAVKKLTESLDYVRFETSEADYTIYHNGKTPLAPTTTVAVGAVTGRVQVLSNRGGLRFNLYDTIHDKAVSCYLRQGQEELMREAWGRRATVSGRVTREMDTGRPIAIRGILNAQILEEVAAGSYRDARGAVQWQQGDKLPEDAIRKLRDA